MTLEQQLVSGPVNLGTVLQSGFFYEFVKEYKDKRVVLKAGGSVLENEHSYTALARIIEEFVKNGAKVYCVVSARKERTNEVINGFGEKSAELGALLENYDNDLIEKSKLNNPKTAACLIQPEIDSAYNLSRELRIPHRVLVQGQGFPIIANSNYLNAVVELGKCKREYLMQKDESVIIVSGFGGENNKGEKVILGRNASDLIQAYIAKLDENVHESINIKDVPCICKNHGCEDEEKICIATNQEMQKLGIKQPYDPRAYKLQRPGCSIRITDLKNPGTLVTRQDGCL